MPYVNKVDRIRLDQGVIAKPSTPGELNYCLTQLCRAYVGTDFGYEELNDVIGALESAKLEFYRRLVSGYEDKKINLNGDVY